jgi:hypothetical protein
MVRWLLVVLIFVLPAQFVWAAVATYCGHESKPTTVHVGHHDHQHQTTVDAGFEDAGEAIKPILLEHDDCTYCQTGVAQFGAEPEAGLVVLQECSFACTATKPYNYRAEEDIERPKWTCAG